MPASSAPDRGQQRKTLRTLWTLCFRHGIRGVTFASAALTAFSFQLELRYRYPLRYTTLPAQKHSQFH
jgi:hypothetical protein